MPRGYFMDVDDLQFRFESTVGLIDVYWSIQMKHPLNEWRVGLNERC